MKKEDEQIAEQINAWSVYESKSEDDMCAKTCHESLLAWISEYTEVHTVLNFLTVNAADTTSKLAFFISQFLKERCILTTMQVNYFYKQRKIARI